MKVLFAVSTEDIAEKIVKVYQTEYKEIMFIILMLSLKNYKEIKHMIE